MDQESFDIDLSDLDDKRHSPRVPVYARVELPWHMSKALRARDVSLTGMRALSRDGRVAHFAGERLHLRFRLPGTEETIEATARVVAQRYAGNDLDVGLAFETLTSESARCLYRFVQKRILHDRVAGLRD
ncbi:MAG: PilZ domain-containing protein [Deltaproteobacteria bacterium]|nr:PilZ domain-containing protein [Deltaproteobacteria bacterium]